MKDEMIGRKFGRLTVIRRATSEEKHTSTRGAYYLCKCACGNEYIARGATLRNGATRSCGCMRKEKKPPVELNRDNFKDVMRKYEKVKKALCEEHDRKCLTTKCPLAKYACYEFMTINELYNNTGQNAKPGLLDAILLAAEERGIEV